ncbi:unnamed protein product, partial [Rangifer tarandus platyrhynchus]
MATAMLATWRGARQGGRRLRQCPLCPRGLKTRRFLPPFPVNSIDLCSSKLSEGEDPGFICEGFLQTLFTAALAPFLPPTHALSLSSGYGLAPVLFEKSVAVRTSLHTLALRPPPGFSLQPLPPHPDVAGPACAQPPLSPCPGALASFTHLSVHSFSNSGTASNSNARSFLQAGGGGPLRTPHSTFGLARLKETQKALLCTNMLTPVAISKHGVTARGVDCPGLSPSKEAAHAFISK